MSSPLDQLVALSHQIGDPAWDAVILGEGNTSIAADAQTFYVKGSGCTLATMQPSDFVHLRRAPIMALLDKSQVSEDELKQVYEGAKVDPKQSKRPSVETVFHALLLSYPGVTAVAHTHATSVNMLTCATHWQSLLSGRLCPDEAVVLGPDSVFVPYVDPGVELAQEIRRQVDAYRSRWGDNPKVIYMQNHGVIALGKNPTEAANITQMAIKAARIRLGAIQAGGFKAFEPATVAHLLGRPDEKYRQAVIA